jgi:hypothetical protein
MSFTVIKELKNQELIDDIDPFWILLKQRNGRKRWDLGLGLPLFYYRPSYIHTSNFSP